MDYEKQVWIDHQTPLDAERLNHMEAGIASRLGKDGHMPNKLLGTDGTGAIVTVDAPEAAVPDVVWEEIKDKPETFPATEHRHQVGEIEGLADVAFSGSYNDLKDKPDGVGEGGNNWFQELDTTLAVSGMPPDSAAVGARIEEVEAKIPDMPETLPNPYALTINGTTYDGSSAVEVLVGSGDSVISSTVIDTTLSQPGAAADAAVVGERFEDVQQSIPTQLPNPHALIMNGVEYDGSEALEIVITGGADAVSSTLIDATLSTPGAAADAAAVGTRINATERHVEEIAGKGLAISETIVLSANTWQATNAFYTYHVNVNGMLETDSPIVNIVTTIADVDALETQLEAWSNIFHYTPGNGSLTIWSKTTPLIDITIRVLVVR